MPLRAFPEINFRFYEAVSIRECYFCRLYNSMSTIQFITFVLTGIGLSFDSFAVSVSCGIMRREIRFFQAAGIAMLLAFFQAMFPLVGWIAGNSVQNHIEAFDHWLAFGLLAFIGGKMIMDGFRSGDDIRMFNPFSLMVILGLAAATSIDALVIGFSFGFLEMPLLIPVMIIGGVTFVASMLGMLCGKNVSARRSQQSMILGGIILTGIGIKIMIEHLLAQG